MINEEFWNRELNLFEIPKFQCPNCQKGLLICGKENIIEKNTKKSEDFANEEGEYYFLEGFFAVISICNNPDCMEITTIVGKTKTIQNGWESDYDYDSDEHFEPFPKYETVYEVKYTNPSIRLISVCPYSRRFGLC